MFALLKKPVRRTTRPLETIKRTLDVGDRAMPLTIRENSRATRITLRIEPGGRALNLTVPVGLKKYEIDDFLARHEGWLSAKLSKFSTDNPIRPGGQISIRGVVHHIEHTGSLRGITEAIVVDGSAALRIISDAGSRPFSRRRRAMTSKRLPAAMPPRSASPSPRFR
jgi:hypothetical protein